MKKSFKFALETNCCYTLQSGTLQGQTLLGLSLVRKMFSG
jgi:hypothetical protein